MKEAIAKSPRTRPQRTSLVNKGKLHVENKDPNFVYRFVNDVEDHIEARKEQGYEVVPASDVKIGAKRVEGTSPEGSAASLSVGQGRKAVLMRIPKEWYEEDQQAKSAEVDRIEQTMKEDAARGNYGKLEISRG